MITLQIISGTDRSDSSALHVAKYLKKRYQCDQVSANIIDLQDFPLLKAQDGQYHDKAESINAFNEPILEADGVVFVCPEYNGGYPGILKLFLDYLPYPVTFHKKPVCFVGESNSPFGAQRAVEQLQQVLDYQKAHTLPERVFIPRIKDNFNINTGIRNAYQQNLLDEQIRNFIPFVKQFK